jgi:hypothetical protein
MSRNPKLRVQDVSDNGWELTTLVVELRGARTDRATIAATSSIANGRRATR